MRRRGIRAPTGTRIGGVTALLLGAPVFAELIQSYLPDTGALVETLFFVVFLAPLYGGAGVLIREASVRFERGWSGRLLLAGAFGVLMPTWIDQSLFTPQTAEEIDLWGDILGSTLVLGISVSAVTSWMVGHVLMSVGAPLVMVEALLPAGRGRTWLGPFGLAVLSVLFVAVAVAIHFDAEAAEAQSSVTRYVVSMVVAIALAVLAFTPLGRPPTPVPGRASWSPTVLVAAGFVLMAAYDLVPLSWVGVTIAWTALAAAAVLLLRLSRSPSWTWRHAAGLAWGAVLERTIIGFLAPPPVDVDPGGKLAQNVLILLLVLGLGWLLWRRTAGDQPFGPATVE